MNTNKYNLTLNNNNMNDNDFSDLVSDLNSIEYMDQLYITMYSSINCQHILIIKRINYHHGIG